MKKLIVFDLDGSLAGITSPIDAGMARLLHYGLLSHLPHDESLANLSLLPACGTKFFRYTGEWEKIYSEDFTAKENAKIIASQNKAVAESGFQAEKIYGAAVEDRGSQVTFSLSGQLARLDEKKKWDTDFIKRIPGFSVRLGGATSVDVTV